MNKPASVAIKELETNIENCINNSGLPPIIIEMVLRGYYIQIKELAKKQMDSESASYEESLKDINKSNIEEAKNCNDK